MTAPFRRTDPITSRSGPSPEAMTQHEAIVLEAMRVAGHPLSDAALVEVIRHLGHMDREISASSIRTRRHELSQRGLVVRAGKRRAPGDSRERLLWSLQPVQPALWEAS